MWYIQIRLVTGRRFQAATHMFIHVQFLAREVLLHIVFVKMSMLV